ncbi:MAG: tetratricopeptide repeat protein [Thermoguttaceae bacterium]
MEVIPRQSPQLIAFYEEYLETQNTIRFIEQVRRTYTQSTLIHLAKRENVLTRRSSLLALGFLGDYCVNELFGRSLHDPDRTVRLLAEKGIKRIWTRAEKESDQQQLCDIIRLIAANESDEAIRRANILIAQSPDFAEVWNQRAIAYFSLKLFDESIADSEITLELNPYHFGAAIGLGYARLQLNEYDAAIVSFEQALSINPNLTHLLGTIRRIRHNTRRSY